MKVRFKNKDSRADKDGIGYLSWGDAQTLLASGAVEIINDEGAAETSGAESGEADYDKMTRAELDALAEERDIDVSGAKTKADVVEAIKAQG